MGGMRSDDGRLVIIPRAEEAGRITAINATERAVREYDQTLQYVKREIKEAIFNGVSCVRFCHVKLRPSFRDEVTAHLESLGYRVSKRLSNGETLVVVEWGLQ